MDCWIGIVEDVLDPLKIGRVRVRVFGYHSELKQDIQTTDLPWALVLQTSNSASISGVGASPGGLVPGSQVLGLFLDGEDAQQPVVLGSFFGIPQSLANTTQGFADPSGTYPKQTYLTQPDTNKLTASGQPHPLKQKLVDRSKSFQTKTADGRTWQEPVNTAVSIYPKNHVTESEVGHITETDDTPGNVRLLQYHAAGTSVEVQNDGTKVSHTVANDYQVTEGNSQTSIEGNLDVTIAKHSTLLINDGLEVQITGDDAIVLRATGNVKITIIGETDISITGNTNLTIVGNVVQKISGDESHIVAGNFLVAAGGNIGLIAGANVTVEGIEVNVNISGDVTQKIGGAYSVVSGGVASIDGSQVKLG